MNSYPHEIAEGEGQKVMIAMAVANQPRLLIADEPTNSLESITRSQIFRLLSSMNQNQGAPLSYSPVMILKVLANGATVCDPLLWAKRRNPALQKAF